MKLTEKIRRQIPNEICLVAVNDMEENDFFFAAEENHIYKAVEKRQKEFRTGRRCARKALSFFGVPPCAIPAGEKGEPLWPSGYVGSITHCRDFYGAAVAKSTQFRSLGIDAEPFGSIAVEVRDQILTDAEKKLYDHKGTEEQTVLLIFSAKESIFKCLHPLVNRYIDFLEIDLILDRTGLTFTAELPHYLADNIGRKILQGVYSIDATHVFTAVFIGPLLPENHNTGAWAEASG